MNIGILSGKGGTGKTTVSTNLAAVIPKSQYLDCDVEEPNGFIFLKPEIHSEEPVEVPVPVFDSQQCSACGKCVSVCQFNALVMIKSKIKLFDKICKGCGACKIVCPEHAISETSRVIGQVTKGSSGEVDCVQGLLNVGEPIAVPIIKQVLNKVDETKTNIIDCPPGTSCTVVNSIEVCDYCILVTEPTVFGLHDLKLAFELLKQMNIPCGVVINKATNDNSIIVEFCQQESLPILATIPFKRELAKKYSEGRLFKDEEPLRHLFTQIYSNIQKEVKHATVGHH